MSPGLPKSPPWASLVKDTALGLPPRTSRVMHLSAPSDHEQWKLLLVSVASELGLWAFKLQLLGDPLPRPCSGVLSLLGCGKDCPARSCKVALLLALPWLDALCPALPPRRLHHSPSPAGPLDAAEKPLRGRPLALFHWLLCRHL